MDSTLPLMSTEERLVHSLKALSETAAEPKWLTYSNDEQ